MPSYHFDLGDSSDGPVGYCARVTAASPAQAVSRLREAIAGMGDCVRPFDDCTDDDSLRPGPGIEYIRVYMNAERITAEAIDDWEERDEDITEA